MKRGDVRVVKREMGVRARTMRMVESREARADPENRTRARPHPPKRLLSKVTDAPPRRFLCCPQQVFVLVSTGQ